jgi:hypothetical protein
MPTPAYLPNEQVVATLTDLANRHRLTLEEVFEAFNQELLMKLDPVKATGPEYSFGEWRDPDIIPDWIWFTPKVPSPKAKVNLLIAWKRCNLDAQACNNALEILERQPRSVAKAKMLIKVLRNYRDWVKFWSIRFPVEHCRARFESEIGGFEEQIAQAEELLAEMGG